ncbi:hypothetical protein BC936DRAFT_142529 [Jimgerdemannia flammicorona]|uniref:C2H2-type domain-containing protein n=1 Tax=Jimgerdemannia flammicorona TaxID=994334 RepID=A0A433A098_9FUNG|nr:hypothetical protein BC936DRAFT_142529 [Jimgerdemannia flammicorona]
MNYPSRSNSREQGPNIQSKSVEVSRTASGDTGTNRSGVSDKNLNEKSLLPYICSEPGCGKAYKKPCKLLEHERAHTGERPFVCSYPNCGKAYRRTTHLSVHMKTHDPDNTRIYACIAEGCTSRFATRQHLTRHSLIHGQERSFQCGYPGCPESFVKSYQLRNHMTTHTGKKPYLCNYEGCTSSFGTSTKLRVHQQVHQARPTTLKCPSPTCTMVFARDAEMKKHVREDHTVVCDVCNRRFKTRDGEARHAKVHLPNRQLFACQVQGCHKTFTSEKSRTMHIRVVHMGLRPYRCEKHGCNREYAHKRNLDLHQLTHDTDFEEYPTQTPLPTATVMPMTPPKMLQYPTIMPTTPPKIPQYLPAPITEQHFFRVLEACQGVFVQPPDFEHQFRGGIHCSAMANLEDVQAEVSLGFMADEVKPEEMAINLEMIPCDEAQYPVMRGGYLQGGMDIPFATHVWGAEEFLFHMNARYNDSGAGKLLGVEMGMGMGMGMGMVGM